MEREDSKDPVLVTGEAIHAALQDAMENGIGILVVGGHFIDQIPSERYLKQLDEYAGKKADILIFDDVEARALDHMFAIGHRGTGKTRAALCAFETYCRDLLPPADQRKGPKGPRGKWGKLK